MSEVSWDHIKWTRKSIDLQASIDVSDTEAAWKLLTSPDHLLKFNPFVMEHNSEGITGPPYEDFCIYFSGLRLNRSLDSIVPSESITFKVWRKKKHTPTTVTFSVASENTPKVSLRISKPLYRRSVRAMSGVIVPLLQLPNYKTYIIGVLRGIRYHLITGNHVSKKSLGSNNLFFPKL